MSAEAEAKTEIEGKTKIELIEEYYQKFRMRLIDERERCADGSDYGSPIPKSLEILVINLRHLGLGVTEDDIKKWIAAHGYKKLHIKEFLKGVQVYRLSNTQTSQKVKLQNVRNIAR